MARELPCEIYGEIISYLWDSKEALNACSVASRILTSPSQKLLFSRLILPGPPKLIVPQYRHSPSIDLLEQSYSHFMRLLARSPHIAEYVECLQIIGSAPNTDDGEQETEDEPFSALMEMFDDEEVHTNQSGHHHLCRWLGRDTPLSPCCRPRLRRLKALVIDYVEDWSSISHRLRSIIFYLLQLPSIVYIEIHTFPTAVLTLPISNNLKHLYLGAREKDKKLRAPSIGLLEPIYLESLFVFDAETFLPFLLTNPDGRIKVDRLRKLVVDLDVCYLGDEGEEDTSDLITHIMTWTLLQTCAGSLEDLTVRPSSAFQYLDGFSIISYQEQIDLSKLTSLRKVEIWLQYFIDDREPVLTSFLHSFWWLDKLLRACSSTNEMLEDITIQVNFDFGIDCVVHDVGSWKGVADALLGPSFPALKRLTIVVLHDDGDILKTILAKLNASEHMDRLRSRPDLELKIIALIHDYRRTHQFAPDPKWRNVTCFIDDR